MYSILEHLDEYGLNAYRDDFAHLITTYDHHVTHGHGLGQTFLNALTQLPSITPNSIDLTKNSIHIGSPDQLTDAEREQLQQTLMQLHPWRKGPFTLFGLDIETEWDSSLKWNRLAPHLRSLHNQKILDIGSSSGYYLFKMCADKPRIALGVEPFIAYYYQYRALQHFARIPCAHTIPCRLEDLPPLHGYFTTVFCMGILYHRRSPLDFLRQMHALMAKEGEIIIDPLTIPGDTEIALTPQKRYAKMHNIFFLPTVPCLKIWLQRCGFTNIRFISTCPTTTAEQRKTPWIQSESLEDFLDPQDPTKTIEGYPAPERTIFIATRKN